MLGNCAQYWNNKLMDKAIAANREREKNKKKRNRIERCSYSGEKGVKVSEDLNKGTN